MTPWEQCVADYGIDENDERHIFIIKGIDVHAPYVKESDLFSLCSFTTPKRGTGGLGNWACGRPKGHPGMHVSWSFGDTYPFKEGASINYRWLSSVQEAIISLVELEEALR